MSEVNNSDTGAPDAAAVAASAAAAAAAAGGGGGGGGAASWFESASEERAGSEELSNRRWIEKKGFTDLNAMTTSLRQAESAVEARIPVPQQGDAPEKFEEYYKKIGRPETADGYEIKMPEGTEANPEFTGRFKAAAFKAGMPAASAGAMVEWWNGEIGGMMQAAATANEAEKVALKGEWGQNYDTNVEIVRRGQAAWKVDDAKLSKIEAALGHMETMKMFHDVGQRTSEDVFVNGERQAFGISAESARAEMAKLQTDREFTTRLRAGDANAKAKWDGLNAAIAHGVDAAKKR
jgi:hypothetical protein